jgi:hypothetical protein
MALEKEVATYRRLHSSLVPQEGRFVLIHGDDLIGTYPTLEEALADGYERFRNEPFLARQITAHDKAIIFSRSIRPCPPSRAG